MDKRFFVFLFAMLLLGAGCTQNDLPSDQASGTFEENSENADVSDTDTGTGTQGIAVGEPNPSAPDQTEIKDEPVLVDTGEVQTFTISGENFAFTPSTMNVKKGDTVRITFKNAEGFHDLKIDEFSVATKQIGAGEEETVEFIADKTGSFEYYCSVGKHREMGMKGTLIVAE